MHQHPTPWRRLFDLIRIERGDLTVVLVYAFAIGLLSLVVPIAVQMLVNNIAFASLIQPVVVLTFIVFLALGCLGVLKVLQASVVEVLQQRLFVRVASDMAVQVARADEAELRAQNGPELINRFFDVMTVQKAAASLLLDGLNVVLATAIGVVLLAFYHPLLLAFDAVLLSAFAFVLFVLGRGAVTTSVKESKAKHATAAWLQQIARNPTAFRSDYSTSFALGRVNDLATDYVHARQKHWKVLVRQIAGSWALYAFASAGLLGVGSFLVVDRQLTIGQLVAAELVVGSVLAGIAKFSKYLESLYDMLASLDKIGHVLELPQEESGGGDLAGAPHRVDGMALEVRGVTVTGVLDKVSMEIPAGGRASLMGSSGAGKSTLVDLLYALRRPEAGSIHVDGMDLRDIELGQYRGQVSIVRSIEIVGGTIIDNVRLGREGLSDLEIRQALEAVGLLDEISALAHGLRTPLTHVGTPLSFGQLVRLMVARAIADRPRLVILDDVLDGLAPDARFQVLSAVIGRRDGRERTSADGSSRSLPPVNPRSLPGANWTTLIITHTAEVATLCDRRFVLDAGLVREV